MTDYIETYRKIPVDKIVEFDETPGFGPWKNLFSPESTKHPAKANLNMLRFLIERFTKPGDVILDPMSGTGSTGTMANLQGRNAILVEYEEKFANMCKDNMELVKERPSLEAKGSTLVVQGDARQLSSILKEKVDFAMFSPPYRGARDYKRVQSHIEDDLNLGESARHHEEYGGKENIGSRPYGDVDSVITSPPYEGTRPWKAKDYEKFSEGMEERTRDGRMERNFATAEAQQRYVDKMQEGSQMTEGNIGQERGKTYLEAMLRVYSESYAVLKPGGLMIIIVKNFVRNWKPVRLDLDTIKLCEHMGFELADHLYRRLKQKSFWIRNYEKQFRKKFPDPNVPLPTAQFEDVLIFQKPTPL